MAEFSYFDQYLDVEVDFTSYLKSISDTYTFTNIQPIKAKLKNMFTKIDIISKFENDIINFDFYTIVENERPESVAYKIYGNVDYFWIIFIFNNIKNVFTQWPLTEQQLYTLSMKMFETEGIYTQTTYYQLLFEQNEKRRQIKLIKSLYIGEVITAFRNEFEKSNP